MLFWRQRHPVDDATLNTYVDGELGGAERARVEAHLETCAACAGTVDELRSLRQTLSALPRARAPRSFALRESDVRPRVTPRWEGALLRWQPALSGVALTAFAAFFLLVGVDVLDLSARSGDERSDGAAVASPESSDGAALSEVAGTPSGASDDAATDRQVPDTQYNSGLSPATPTSPPPDGKDAAADGEGVGEGPSGFIAQPGSSPEGPVPSPESSPTNASNEDGASDDVGLRVAEGVAAAVALTAGGSLAFVWWRRRTD